MSQNQIVVASLDSNLVTFTTKKGENRATTAEGALFMGKPALDALKNTALELALKKAANGRYQAACDIISAGFPKIAKAYATLFACAPHSNKAHFVSFVRAAENAQPGKNGWSTKQAEIRMLVAALANMINTDEAGTAQASPAQVIENTEG